MAPARHAIVLGGSIAGLIAARVLSDHFQQVTLIDRSTLADGNAVRSAVPQGVHVHAMLARGLQVIEALFPGYTDELVADGASLIGVEDTRIYISGWRKSHDHPMKVLSATRPQIEWGIARRLRQIRKISFIENTEAIGLRGNADRVTAVLLKSGEDEREMSADLIVDARGRRSNLSDWLKTLGAETPEHETSPLSSAYASYLLSAEPGTARPPAMQIARMEERLGVLLFPVEGNRILLSIGANGDVSLPKDHAAMLKFVSMLPVPDAYDALKNLTPITQVQHSRFTASVKRNFDKLSNLPAGVIAIGDAIASFNPIFGQGMTVAALEAECLGKCLTQHDGTSAQLPKTFYAGAKPIIDIAWGFPDLEAKRNTLKDQNAMTRFLLWYTYRMTQTATRSSLVSRTIAEVQNMLAPPAALFRPSIFWRVLFA